MPGSLLISGNDRETLEVDIRQTAVRFFTPLAGTLDMHRPLLVRASSLDKGCIPAPEHRLST